MALPAARKASLVVMEIITYPNPILTTVCDPVEMPCDLRAEVEEMQRLIRGIGVGLAANQVGILKRFCVFNYPPILVNYMINPEITWHSKKAGGGMEECLSVGKQRYPKKRYSEISVKWQNMDGKEFERTFRGLSARILQHEIDHLNGILINQR